MYIIMTDKIPKKESVLEAFLRQSKIDPNSYDQSEEYEKILEEEEKRQAMMRYTQQTKGAFSYKSISDKVNIPTQIKSSDLNQKTEPSSQFKDYDHSLEEDRWNKIGGKSSEEGDDGIIMEDIG